jgi:hypothetical protein
VKVDFHRFFPEFAAKDVRILHFVSTFESINIAMTGGTPRGL